MKKLDKQESGYFTPLDNQERQNKGQGKEWVYGVVGDKVCEIKVSPSTVNPNSYSNCPDRGPIERSIDG